jgi:succinoglycan biosynthesis protein ExoL
VTVRDAGERIADVAADPGAGPDAAGPAGAPLRIAFFGHNAGDAAVRRRATAFMRAGYEVAGLMPHRGPRQGENAAPPWRHVDLGETRDNRYVQRVSSIFAGARRAARHEELLRGAGLLYARNLDMLAMASLVRRRLGLAAPLVYECLDVHHRLTGPSRAARALRGLERRLLEGCALVVISSPRFETEHFAVHYPGLCRFMLVENRLIEGDAFAPRPAPREAPPGAARQGPLRIGWFGNLRCRRSFDLLAGLAARFPGRVEIVLRGYPAPGVFDDLPGAVSAVPGMRFEGRYRAPGDLAAIYREVDLIWAGDWYEEGANSLWLLPNRIYEGGYFATPALAPAGTETARWVAEREAGFLLEEPVAERLAELVARLLDDPGPMDACRARLLALPRETFVEGPATAHALVTAAMGAPAVVV